MFKGTLIMNANLLQYKLTRNRVRVLFDFMGGEGTTYCIFVFGEKKLYKPLDPTKDERIFDNWYLDDEYKTKWDFENDLITQEMLSTATSSEMKLFAKWI